MQFIDLEAQRKRLGEPLEASILKVVRSGKYILGPEIDELETALARFCGAPYAMTCANGTDALVLLMMIKGVKQGDAVLVPSYTYAATGEAVVWLGAEPVFVDVDEHTFNMDPQSLRAGIRVARARGLRPVGVIPVDLFGLPADYDSLDPIVAEHGLWSLCDTAQGFGATYKSRRTGAIGDCASTSFFPAKPLGCYGDGGAVFVRTKEELDLLKSLRVHGQGVDKYDNVRLGMNGRMDTIQAAVLLHKLAIFEDEIVARDRIAKRYSAALADVATVPIVPNGCSSVWAQYTLRVPAEKRETLIAALAADGIPTAVYYRFPMHRQTAYKHYAVAGDGLPVSDRLSRECVSLPMHPYLDEATQDRICARVRSALAS